MALALRLSRSMAEILAWPRERSRRSRVQTETRIPGAYAGHARFRPRDIGKLPHLLAAAADHVVEVAFAGIAPANEPFAGQALFLEWRNDDLLHGFLVPEQDLEFLIEQDENTADRVRG